MSHTKPVYTHIRAEQVKSSLAQNDSFNESPLTLADDADQIRAQIRKVMGVGANEWSGAVTQDLSKIYGSLQVGANGVDSTIVGALTVTDLLTANGGLSVNADSFSVQNASGTTLFSVDASTGVVKTSLVANQLVNVDASGNLVQSADMSFDGIDFKVFSTALDASASSVSMMDGSVIASGAAADAQLAVAGVLTADRIKDAALTQHRVLLAGAAGELGDDANLTFDGSHLKAFDAGAAGSALDVSSTEIKALSGKFDMTAASMDVYTNVLIATAANADAGIVASVSMLEGTVVANPASEAYQLVVTGNQHITGDMMLDGNFTVKGAMTTIDTVNVKLRDAIAVFASPSDQDGGDVGASVPRGIVLHGAALDGSDDGNIALGAKSSGHEFVFAKKVDDSSVMSGNSPSDIFAAAALAKVWAADVKLGAVEGTLKGELKHVAAAPGGGSDIIKLQSQDLDVILDAGSANVKIAANASDMGKLYYVGGSAEVAALANMQWADSKLTIDNGVAGAAAKSMVFDPSSLVLNMKQGATSKLAFDALNGTVTAANNLSIAAGAASDLSFTSYDTSVSLAGSTAEYTAFYDQYGAGTSILAALAAAGAGAGSLVAHDVLAGALAHGTSYDFSAVLGGSLRDAMAAEKHLHVYLNGARLISGVDYSVDSVSAISFFDDLVAGDALIFELSDPALA